MDMDELLDKIADDLRDSGGYDSVRHDGDGMILVAIDGMVVSLTAAELERADADDADADEDDGE